MTTQPAVQHSPLPPRILGIQPLPDPPTGLDRMRQIPHIARNQEMLQHHFQHRPDVLVSGDGYFCRIAAARSGWLKPDCVVAFGVNPENILDRNGYVINEVGKPPEFVLEVGSPSTGRRDVLVKPHIYAGFGVAEYWRFDWTGGEYHGAPLWGGRREGLNYRPIPLQQNADGLIWGRSEALGLDLCWERGRLNLYDPAAQCYLEDLSTAARRADAAALRADAAAERADAEAERADAAQAAYALMEARNARLEARQAELEAELRRLRGETP